MFNNPTDKNTQKPNSNTTPSIFGNQPISADNKPATGSLFGNTTGGLFGNAGGSGLFPGTGNSQLKTTQRKQGGLFGSINGPKTLGQEAPKLSFGGFSTTTPTSGGLFGSSLGGKKQQASSNGLFLAKPTTGLFPTTTPGGGLFGGITTQQQPKQAEVPKQQIPQTGLFSGMGSIEPKKEDKPAGLFGGPPSQGLFGSTTPGGLFGGQKKQGGLFGASTAADSSLFSRTNQPTASFASTSKNEEIKKQTPSGGLFGNISTATPGSSTLFGGPTIQKKPIQTPQFSLTGNASLETPKFGGNGGLFGNVSAGQQKPASSTEIKPQLSPKLQEQKFPQTGLFGGVIPTSKPKQETAKQTVPSLLGNTGGLFGASKTEVKPSETTGGLFGKVQKKEASPTLTPSGLGGSLFGQGKEQAARKQTKPTSGAFQQGSSLFNKPSQQKVDKPSSLFPIESKTPQMKQAGNLLQVIYTPFKGLQEQKTLKQQINNRTEQSQNVASRRETRTISFNEGSGEKYQAMEARGGVFDVELTPVNNRAQTVSKPVENQQPSVNLAQGVTSPMATSPEGSRTTLPQQPTAQIQKPAQSFFKPLTQPAPKPTIPQQQVFTSHQISLMLSKQLQTKSTTISQSQRQQRKKSLKLIEQWIEVSFTRSNEIISTEMRQRQFQLHQNEDINRFLNDLCREVVEIVNLPVEEKSFKLMHKLFDELLQKLDIKQFLFKCTKVPQPATLPQTNQPTTVQIIQLNTSYFQKHQVYKFTPQSIYLNLDSSQVQRYILSMTKKFLSNQLQYIEFLQTKIELLQLPHSLFYHLLKYSLNYNRSRTMMMSNKWNQKMPEVIELVQDFQKKIVVKITLLLKMFTDENFHSFALINKQLLPETIKLLDNFSYTEDDQLITLALKVILNGVDLSTPNTQSLTPLLKTTIKQTKSLQLLPFRTLVSCIQPTQQYRLSPSAHDLYRYISGPEWLDWLQLYLTNGVAQSTEKEVSILEARYMIKVLAYPSLGKKRINRAHLSPKQIKYLENLQKKILSRKRPICKFILSLKEQNMLDIFYLILTSLIYDYESYRRISETFFRQKDEFSYQFRTVVAEICNYPVQQFKEEIPFLEEKILYFLRLCEVAPDRALELERLVFDGVQITFRPKETSEVDVSDNIAQSCHRLCHLVIDTITYFSLRQNQVIIAKCISTIKSLLQNEQTSQPMNLAMSINKPQLAFITAAFSTSSQLSQTLVKEMIQLLQYFLTSDEWTTMLCTKLRTNNWQNSGLQRYYAVRYSVKDYSVVVREVITKQQETNELLIAPLTLTHSSYWLLRCLQVMVQAFQQQQSQSMRKTLLYTLNLIVEKLFMPMSQNIGDDSSMLEQSFEATKQSNNPIYSSSQSLQIPKVLAYLVESLNSIDIFALFQQNLSYRLSRSGQHMQQQTLTRQPIYQLRNKLIEESSQQNQLIVYLTVRLLKKLLLVYRVYEGYKNSKVRREELSGGDINVKGGEHHFVYKLLNRLKWMTEVEYGVLMNGGRDVIVGEGKEVTRKINVTVGIVTLLIQDQHQPIHSQTIITPQSATQSPAINLKQQNYQLPFIIPLDTTATSLRKPQLSSLSVVQKFYSQYGEKLNFETVNNFLVLTENKYLQSYQSLQTLCCDALGLMVGVSGIAQQQQSINLVKALGFYSDTLNPTLSSTWLTEHLQSQLLSLLSSRYTSIQLKSSILNLLHQLINNSTSASFIIAKKIFYTYLTRHLNLRQQTKEMSSRLSLTVVKIMNLLEEKDQYVMRLQCTDRFVDSLMEMMLLSCENTVKSTNAILKAIKSFFSKPHHPIELAYYHLERTCQQRQLITIGGGYELLAQILSLVQKRFFDVGSNNVAIIHKWKVISQLNTIMINAGLPYLDAAIVDANVATISQQYISTTRQNKLQQLNISLPRCFITNPLQHYISNATHISYSQYSFRIYKQNVIDYLSLISIKLGQSAMKFLNWTLTIDKTLYGNQPISPRSRQLCSAINDSIICSSHMGSYNHTAVQMFAQSQQQAITLVKQLYDMSFGRLQQGMTIKQQQCFSIMGYCLQWLRRRNNTSDTLLQIVKKTIKHSFWLDSSTIRNRTVIKFFLSIMSLSNELMIQQRQYVKLRAPVLQMVHKFMRNKTTIDEAIVQQLVSVLVSMPLEDSGAISEIVQMWRMETNNEYFYNQSRLILQIAQRSPIQLAKLKPLTTCQKIRKLQATTIEYNYNLRHPDAVAFIWSLKVATMLMSTEQQSIIVFEQVKEYFTAHNSLIYQLLLSPPVNITIVYLQQLEALLQFLLSLVTSQSWLTVQRQQFEKITYLLSHKLVNFVVDYIAGRVKTEAVSDMERRFRKIKVENVVGDQLIKGGNASIQIEGNSVFRLLTDTKMSQLINTFTLLLTHCFHQSHYIHNYFNQEVFENYRYGVSFWDRMNKSICDIVKYSVTVTKKYKRTQQLNQKLIVVEDCINSPEFFVESGYLSSLYGLPTTTKELFIELNEFTTNSLSLGNVHLIQSRTFRQKYQCLMKGNIQKFGKRLMENVKIVQALVGDQEENQTGNDKRYYEQLWRNLESVIRSV